MDLEAAFAEFITDRESNQLRPASLRFYRTHVGAFVAYLKDKGIEDVDGLDRHAVRLFYAHLRERDLSQATRAAYDRAIRAFCRFCLQERWIDDDPMRGRRRIKPTRKLPDAWEPGEVLALLATCDGDPVGLRDRAIMLLMLDTGLRAGEVIALRQNDLELNEDRGRVWVRAEGSKSDSDRIVPLYADTVFALHDWLAVRPDGASTVFVAVDGRATLTTRPLTTNGLNQLMRRRVELAGIPMKRRLCHIWRHTFAKHYVLQGGDLETLRRILGHRSLETTQVYLGFRDQEVEDRHHELSPVRHLYDPLIHVSTSTADS